MSMWLRERPLLIVPAPIIGATRSVSSRKNSPRRAAALFVSSVMHEQRKQQNDRQWHTDEPE
jgi:hypothetical protein